MLDSRHGTSTPSSGPDVQGLSQNADRGNDASRREFQIARLIYDSYGMGGGARGRGWWAIDYPEAEYHFVRGIRRLTRLDIADDSIHLRATDPQLFDYPWLFAQQVGRWDLSQQEADALREYLLRGGIGVDPEGSPPTWKGIFDDQGRLMVVMNYIMYAMTH